MLGDYPVIAMIATTQPERAKHFYSDVLGLKLVEDGWFAIVFTAGGTRLHIQKVKQFSPLPFTAMGWTVADIAATVARLAHKGVKFERYKEMPQDDAGVWTTPDGTKVCWFKDPDGNTLSLTQFPSK
ncbi:VOC family protein [Candidatus Binatus soli]|jgi:catechol 2,3-dioxygenase-like lactoylglutathione lyase family enzyme|uniref:VOC family protein n=1 Tax=Candidatus Binatus soli TaxID=1953413 RepID=UPI003D133DBB